MTTLVPGRSGDGRARILHLQHRHRAHRRAVGRRGQGHHRPEAHRRVRAVSLSATDAVTDEKFAILLYHLVTDQTGDPAQEWPPTDCGSNGLYVSQELIKLGFASSYKAASSVTGAITLLQTDIVMQGGPWFNSWIHPDSHGFVDGDGSIEALQAAIQSGVAGGHETLQHGIPQIAQLSNGSVDLPNTYIKVRNSWSTQFGLGGDYLLHASTLSYLGRHYDYKAVIV